MIKCLTCKVLHIVVGNWLCSPLSLCDCPIHSYPAVIPSRAPSPVAKQDVVEAGCFYQFHESSPSPTSCLPFTPSCCSEASDWISSEWKPFPESSAARKSVSKPANPVWSRSNAGVQIWDRRLGEWSSNHSLPDRGGGACGGWHTLPVWRIIG